MIHDNLISMLICLGMGMLIGQFRPEYNSLLILIVLTVSLYFSMKEQSNLSTRVNRKLISMLICLGIGILIGESTPPEYSSMLILFVLVILLYLCSQEDEIGDLAIAMDNLTIRENHSSPSQTN